MQEQEKSREVLLAELEEMRRKLDALTSNRQRDERARYISESTLESIVRSIPDIIYRVDGNGTILFISDAVRKYGYDPAELVGTNFLDLVHPDDREKASYRINEKRTGERRTEALELRLLTRDRHAVAVEVRENEPTVLLSAEGIYATPQPQSATYVYTQGIICDATARRQLEEERRQADHLRVLAETAGGAAHEISQPLTGIIGIVELALVEMAQDDPRHGDFQEGLAQARRIGTILVKMKNVQKYATKPYIQGERIADFGAASQEGEEGE